MEESSSLCCVPPPGFRFHPTEEELVGYYLARKVAPSTTPHKTTMDIIQEVDLHSMEPWDLQRMLCSSSKNGGQCCYFFSHKDRKYPGGTRTNRATAAGFWKATGRDKPVLSSSRGGGGRVIIIGMRKTLVFYEGRAPNGRRTDWIMHEYRLHSNLPAAAQAKEEASWVVCRAFQKPIPNQQSLHHHPYPCGGYDDHHRFLVGSTPSLPQLMDDEQLLIQQQQQEGGGGGGAAVTTIDWNWNFLDSLFLSSSTPASSQLAPP